MKKKISERKKIYLKHFKPPQSPYMYFYSLDFYVLFHKSLTEEKIKVLNYSLHILIVKLPHCWSPISQSGVPKGCHFW